MMERKPFVLKPKTRLMPEKADEEAFRFRMEERFKRHVLCMLFLYLR
jgi:hypothetical protein